MNFLLTVAKNDIDKARQLLQTGIDVNSPILWNAKNTYSPVIPTDIASQPDLLARLHSDQEYQSRPLNIAVLGGHLDMVRLLLSAGADINLKDGRGRTALICAIYGLDLDTSNINTTNLHLISQTHEAHLSIMKNVLLRHPNLYVATLDAPQYEIKGITPLCLASYLGKSEIIQLLLEDGRVDVNGTDSKNASALMYAARDGNLPIVQMLLSYDASPDITDSHGWSAIQYAEMNPDIVQLCEESLRRKRPDVTMIHAPVNPIARYPASYTKLSTLISSLPQYQSSLSHLDFKDVLQDVDLMDPITAPIVQLVQMAFVHAIKSHDHVSLQTLLLWSPPLQLDNKRSSGALLINYHDPKTGLSAIHHALRAKPLPSLDTLTMLYQAGADINAQTYYGRTALHHLARIGVDKDGKSWGIQKSPTKVAQHQQEHSRLRANSSSSSTPTMPTHLEEDTSQLRLSATQGSDNRLSTISAISSRSALSDTTTLRTTTADLLEDPFSKSILAAPTIQAHLGLCASLLIHFGALVNIADPTGNTPLHFAAEFGAVNEVLEVLIMNGNADLHLKNKKQQTPLDVCKTEDVRKYMLGKDQLPFMRHTGTNRKMDLLKIGLEKERKTSHRSNVTLSCTSANTNTNGSIVPFDTASDYNNWNSLTRSLSRSTLQSNTLTQGFSTNHPSTTTKTIVASPPSVILPTSISEAAANRTKELKKKGDVLDQIDADFEQILNAFFSYQTTFTDSIEKALAYITETILQSWQPPPTAAATDTPSPPPQLERTIVQLRFELREAHDMFDQTDQRAEKIMLHYREELEQVEQIHQADCELLDLQQDKVDKLFDVFERIDSRFCQLEVDQDELIGQVETARKLALGRLKQPLKDDVATHMSSCMVNLMQALAILTTLPTKGDILALREDRVRLYRDLDTVVQQVLQESSGLDADRAALEEKWHQVEQLLTVKPPSPQEPAAPHHDNTAPPAQSAKHWQRQCITASLYSASISTKPQRSLNELELSFDILSTNLSEIQKDMDDLTNQCDQVMEGKKRMYDVCLALEKELDALPQKETTDRTEAIVRRELDQVMQCTQTLFTRQSLLDQEAATLKMEHEAMEKRLEGIKDALRQVRPPLLLQGLLERLDTDDGPVVRVEKEWQEDPALVTTFMDDLGDDCFSSSSSTSSLSSSSGTNQMKITCPTRLSLQCLIARLDASLYCLKVLAAHHISRSRHSLLEAQASLTQASEQVDEARCQMTQLYADAAEVARQVYVFKTEVEMIIRHRKEEVVKVWEVVDEVSVGIDTTAATQQYQPTSNSSNMMKRNDTPRADDDEQDRHQWILRELERFQIVHENLQDAIEELKRQQTDIGQRIRHVASSLIDPQVDRLVGQGESSLLSISDYLAELMDGIRIHDLGLNLNEKDTGSTMISGRSSSHTKRISLAMSVHTTDNRKRMSIMSTSSLSSLSSYQQERMLSRASQLSQVLNKHHAHG
ncbi:hypothetical protein [Absidia glauca]|uniref:Uncharacterized protein n=1 Tax=Absidia glauca TaxID=4829 RepID=A0A168LDZ2_ABSGL|nr:hypothetical protein [Absidia glauca]